MVCMRLSVGGLAACALYGCDAKGPHVRRPLPPLAVKSS